MQLYPMVDLTRKDNAVNDRLLPVAICKRDGNVLAIIKAGQSRRLRSYWFRKLSVSLQQPRDTASSFKLRSPDEHHPGLMYCMNTVKHESLS